MTGIEETMATIRRAITDRDDTLRRNRLRPGRTRTGADTTLHATIRYAIEDYADTRREETRAALTRAIANADALRRDIGSTDKRNDHLEHALEQAEAFVETLRDELTETRASLEGQLAIAAGHICEPLPQRTRQVNAAIREGLNTPPEPNPTPPATAEPAADGPRAAPKPRSRPSRSPGKGAGPKPVSGAPGDAA
jgi:Predicted coiled-coil domain-containing protein